MLPGVSLASLRKKQREAWGSGWCWCDSFIVMLEDYRKYCKVACEVASCWRVSRPRINR